jgi:rhodanese-related sulfurtransferase
MLGYRDTIEIAKMGKNTKPMLTVLVEEDKLQQLRDYALGKEVSMGWIVNRLIDRLLSGELDVMGDPSSTEVTREPIDIESLVVASIEKMGLESELTQLRTEVAEIKKLIADRPSAQPTAAKEPTPPPDTELVELARSGLKATAIAAKLTELGYTNTKGEPLTRENINSRLKANSGLKAIYDTAKP